MTTSYRDRFTKIYLRKSAGKIFFVVLRWSKIKLLLGRSDLLLCLEKILSDLIFHHKRGNL